MPNPQLQQASLETLATKVQYGDLSQASLEILLGDSSSQNYNEIASGGSSAGGVAIAGKMFLNLASGGFDVGGIAINTVGGSFSSAFGLAFDGGVSATSKNNIHFDGGASVDGSLTDAISTQLRQLSQTSLEALVTKYLNGDVSQATIEALVTKYLYGDLQQISIEALQTELSQNREMSGGVVFGEEIEPRHFHPKATCGIVDKVIDCGCIEPQDIIGGCVFGSASWLAVNKTGDSLFAYYPLAWNEGEDIANANDAIPFGELDVTRGLICENAEQFRKQRYYETAYPQYWNGLTISFWYKHHQNINETTIFSFDPALRLGLTWLGEPTIKVAWYDETEQQAYSNPIDNSWHFWTLLFRPNDELALFIDSVKVITIPAKDFFDVAPASFIGSLQNGSYIQGELQDFRIYLGDKSYEFIEAEKDSYCETWIETVD